MATITAKNGKDGPSGSIEYDFGANMQELAAKVGEQAVYDMAVDQMTVRIQAIIRGRLVKGESLEGLENWLPGSKAPRAKVDPVMAVKAAFAGMSEEEKKEFIKLLKGM